MSTKHGKTRGRGGVPKSWVWDYFSIKDDSIEMSVCDICSEKETHNLNSIDISDMKKHLLFNHAHIYKIIINRKIIHWESHFERMQSSTHSTNINIKCKHCNPARAYNILLRVSTGSTMESHLKEQHNVTESDWEYFQDWRNMNTQDYYKLTQKPKESKRIKRTTLCKKCHPPYLFRRSNLCIMLKHLIQIHRNDFTDPSSDKLLPLDKLPKKLIELFFPVNASTGRILQPSSSGECVIREPA